jgi:hypothetical protein
MINRDNISDWLNRADYTAEERRNICAQIMSEAQYWDSTQYQRMMHDSTKRTWVGLTDEDCEEVERWVEFKEEGSGRIPIGKLARYIDAKLKEKNGYAEGKNT